MAPYAKGGKIGLFGGAGVGKTVLIQELDHKYRNTSMVDIQYSQVLVSVHVKVMILWTEMKESGVLEKTALVFGQMNEPPGAQNESC